MINKSTMLFVSVVLFVYCFDGRTVFAPTEYFVFLVDVGLSMMCYTFFYLLYLNSYTSPKLI